VTGLPPAVSGDWPEFGLVDDIRPALAAAMAAGKPAAFATLHAAQGGAPRGVGAQILFTEDDAAGYVSGGCVEADIACHAMEVLGSGEPRRLVYGRGGPLDIQLPCGGRIELLVERILPDDAAARRLVDLMASREAALWLTNGYERAVLAEGEDCSRLPSALRGAFAHAQGASPGDGSAIYRVYEPPRRAIVLGSDPTALAFASMAAMMAVEVTLVRPSGPALPPPLAGISYRREGPGAAIASLKPDRWTSVVIAMHDEINDHEALMTALRSQAFYVGLLGSRRRLGDKLDRLRDSGLDAATIARLRAPIGLPLGGSSPWEIALSILAEITRDSDAIRLKSWPAADARAA
jgi:xanthine dehydrogenase accessory factor